MDADIDIVSKIICDGAFINTRRAIKRYLMISRQHPLTGFYVKSLYQFRLEEQRHMIKYYRMIHPFSMFTFVFRVYMSCILAMTYIWWPIIAAHWTSETIHSFYTISYFSHIALIVLSFFIGYYDKMKNHVVLNPHKIALDYITSYFVFDIISVVPFFFKHLIWKMNWDMDNIYIRNLIWSLPLFTYVRYFYFMETFYQVKLYTGLNNYVYNGIRCIINLISFVLGLNLIVFYLLIEIPEFRDRPPFESAMSTFEILMMIGHGVHKTDHIVDRICPVLLILCGFVIHLVLLVYVMEFWYQFYSTANKQQTVYGAIEAYMTYKALPVEERKRIFLFLNFKYERHFYKDSSITKITTPSLRREILIKLTEDSTKRVDIFKHLPEHMLLELRASLTYMIVLPGDDIIKAGTIGNCMYFILAGTVVVTTAENKELCRLRDGTHFGEIALVANIARVANVTALTPCKLFKLKRYHFLNVIRNYPDMYDEIKRLATLRLADAMSELESKESSKEINVSF